MNPLRVLILLVLAVSGISTLSAQTTAFTYQGHLMDAGASANGTYDLTFTLKTALTGGSMVGGTTTQTVEDVQVTNGIFTTTIDFGSSGFLGGDRWLEMAVRPGASVGVYTMLAPRQKITSAPYAVRSINASVATSAVNSTNAVNLTGALIPGNIPANLISSTMIANGAIGSTQLGANAVQSGNIAAGAVGNSELAANAVQSGNIAAGAVGAAQIAASAVGATQIAAGAVGSSELAANAVQSSSIAAGAVTSAKIASGIVLPTQAIAAAGQAAAANTSYAATGAGTTTFTLPTTASAGDVVQVTGIGSGGWTVQATGGQIIQGAGLNIAAGTWTETPMEGYWGGLACSADGTRLVAVDNGNGAGGGRIYTSPNFGLSWTARATQEKWIDIASSADGSKLVAVTENSSTIWISTDSGVTWDYSDVDPWDCSAVAISADGSRMVVATHAYIFTSSDGGGTWTERNPVAGPSIGFGWKAVASSEDGARLAVVRDGGQIYTSADFGATWFAQEIDRDWSDIACSADGSRLIASVRGGQLYVSSDFGQTWLPKATAEYWESVVSSASGAVMYASGATYLYQSSDYGQTWSEIDSLGAPFNSGIVALSSDGTRLIAAYGSYSLSTVSTYNANAIGPTVLNGYQGESTTLTYLGAGQWAIGSKALFPSSVESTHISAGAVTSSALANGVVSANKLESTLSADLARRGSTNTFAADQRFSADVGIGATNPLARLHIMNDSISPVASALETDEIIVGGQDAAIGLYSPNDGSYGAALSLKEINGDGTIANTWGLVRKTTGGGGDLLLTYGASDNYASNPAMMTLKTGGDVSATGSLTTGKFNIFTNTTLNPTGGVTLAPTTGYVKMSPASAVILSATTAIASGTAVGQQLILQGTSNTNTVQINDGAGTELGNNRILGASDTLTLIWDGSRWVEMAYSNN